MIRLNKEQVVSLHLMAIAQTGGSEGVMDEGLLESAINAPFQSFDGEDLYPSIASKAARMCCSLIRNHPFVDGNKRVGILAMLVFLDVNRISVDCSDQELVDLGIGVADGRYDDRYILDWVIQHDISIT